MFVYRLEQIKVGETDTRSGDREIYRIAEI